MLVVVVAMMATRIDPRLSLREAVESLHVPEVTGPLDELSDVLLQTSALVSHLRRCIDARDPRASDVRALDDSFSKSIVLTRALRERLRATRQRGEYSSMSYAAREVVGRLQGSLAESVSLSLRCPSGPAIIAAERDDLRRLLVALVECGIDAVGDGGSVELDLSEGTGPSSERARHLVLLELRCSGALNERDDRIAAFVRPLVRALGGSLIFRELPLGRSVLAVRLPCAC